MRIAVVAPACPIDRGCAERVGERAAALYGDAVTLDFHPQCFLTAGHFAGSDAERLAALLEVASDPAVDAVWFARGGYGSARIVEPFLAALPTVALDKQWLGYSDAGTLLAVLYARGAEKLAHGPMPADIRREGGEAAIERALAWLAHRDPRTLEPGLDARPAAAFNLTILSHLIGAPWMPDLTGHVLLIEDVAEYHYRIDRALAHVTAHPNIRQIAGLRAGRFSDVTENDRPFGHDTAAILAHWCEASGIPHLGEADIGHDADNKVVPFGPTR